MRTLVLSIGNTSLFGGVAAGERLGRTFRLAADNPAWASGDSAGSVETTVLRSGGVPAAVSPATAAGTPPLRRTDGLARLSRQVRGSVERAALCSVVPGLTPKVVRLIRQTWGVEVAVLTAEAAHGLTVGYRRPRELGADRVATALGARALFPGKNVIVVDCGTATTVTALRRDGTVLGGAIFPGLSLWPEMLVARTAQLPRVAPVRPMIAVGRSPREGIGSGVFFGQVGAIREVVARVRAEAFGRAAVVVVGTGGHAPWFRREKLFTVLAPQLVLEGLRVFAAAGH